MSARIARSILKAIVLPALVAWGVDGGRVAGATETSIRLTSDADDPVGQGVEFMYTDGIASFSVTSDGDRVMATVDPAGPGEVWSFEFEAPSGVPLLPGNYPAAEETPASGGMAGLRIAATGRDCSENRGCFDIRQLSRDPLGQVTALRVLFEQHCDGQPAALRGELCFNADVPLRIETQRVVRYPRGDVAIFYAFLMDAQGHSGTLSLGGNPTGSTFEDFHDNTGAMTWATNIDNVGRWPMTVTGIAGSHTEQVPVYLEITGDNRLVLAGESGEPLSGGGSIDQDGWSGWFVPQQEPGGVSVDFTSWGGDAWSVRMLGPDGAPLSLGMDRDASFPASPGNAYLEVRHNGAPCPSAGGHLLIKELIYDADGYLQSFRASFEQRCAPGSPALRGEIWSNARAVVSMRSPGAFAGTAGDAFSFEVVGDDSRGGTPVLLASGLPPGATFNDNGNGTGHFFWNSPAALGSDVTLVFQATAADGRHDQSITHIHVIRPNSAPLADAAGPYDGGVGESILLDGTGSNDADGDSLTYHWFFGDGEESTLPSPSHAWGSDGSFSVVLEVSDGMVTDRDSTSATIAKAPPKDVTVRAFLIPPNKEFKLFNSRPWLYVQLERMDRSFRLGEVDQRSLCMVSVGTGPIDRVFCNPRRTVIEPDTDGNRRRELSVAFDSEDLQKLFAKISRPTDVPVRIEGMLKDGRLLHAELIIPVRPKPPSPVKQKSDGGRVGLTVETAANGRLLVQIFAPSGQLVRTLDDAVRPAGVYDFDLEGAAEPLAAGIYFYRVLSDDVVTRGRLVLVR